MTERENAVALYTFLKEFAQLRTRTIRDISQYERDGQIVWASDIPRESGCYCIAWDRESSPTSDEIWLEIRKPRLTRPPEPPSSVIPWVRQDQLGDSSLDFPELYETLLSDSADGPPLRLEDHTDVREAWDIYIDDHWWTWAERDRREQEVSRIYTDIFSMFQRQQRLGENFEVVFGLGFLTWEPPDGGTVRRHLIAAHVSIAFDTVSGTLTVIPAGEGARPSFEHDMLDPQYRPDPHELSSLEKEVEGIADSLWEVGPLDGLLKSWVNSASASGEYSPVLDPSEHVDQKPMVHLAPALILRRRTERSFIRAFEDIITQLEAGEPVPEGVSRFISITEDKVPDSVPADSSQVRPSETLFPLPANDAQRQVVERLAANQGVLVQGPPGTGKSHTIVNLICHALATGQRVLVTSHAPRALTRLDDMIREHTPDIAPLSVVLLGDNQEALLAMEESVQGITTRQWTPMESQTTIASLESELDQGRRNEAKVLATLRAIREKETFKHDAKFGYTGTLAWIADTLRNERDLLSWIPGDIPEDTEPPLTAAGFSELVSLLRNERISEWEATGWVSVSVDGLPTAEDFDKAVQDERVARGDYERDASIRQRREYNALQDMHEHDRLDLMNGLSELVQLIERIHRRPLPWTRTATKQVLGDLERAWRLLHEDTKRLAESTAGPAEWLDRNPITPDPGSNLQQFYGDAKDLLDHLKGGGGWGFGPFRAAVVKRASYIRKIRIGGRLCETADTVSNLVARLHTELEFMQLRERWEPHHAVTATTFAEQVAELKDLCEPLEEAFMALAITERLSDVLRRASASFDPDWSDLESVHRLRETLSAFKSARLYEVARGQIDQTLEDLHTQRFRGRLARTAEALEAAIAERDTSTYATARQRAADELELEAQLGRKRSLLGRLRTGAPELTRTLLAAPADAAWDERVPKFERAWNWSRAHAWVVRLAAPDSERQHRLELENTKNRIARTLEGLAAEKAWAHCFERMTEKERQHLIAWSKAVRAIGRNEGKYASRNRRIAREHLNESRSAIPAWVMPLHRVAETIKPGSEMFDIAIIDEASQSGPEALLLAYLAKKIVVVGDDKQIHPTYAGINYEDVDQLRERYIAHLPHADAYGVYHSFYDLAQIRHKSWINLREHFRCMPEIIQFSNNLSYQGEPLIPLRQYGAGRLEPAVTTRHVSDGYQQGTGARSINPPEVEAIVKEIARTCADPNYQGKTIGIISLVGDAQAREIEARLVRELGPEEMERRQIVCGDAYAFQGDERDVMFLSMVSAPREDRRIAALTDQRAQRRFNVAASRARDQMWLFHTATLNDLSGNPDCVRRKLLEYCIDPKVVTPDVSGLDVPALERMAFEADHQHVSPPNPFDSWFELDVFLRIARQGYRVIPQFEVGGYRIDLVVQGMDGSLAVECDGDIWHGPERYEADAARQRDLERCGWEFWRIRESVFRLDPDEALIDLWKTLERRNVFTTAEEEMRRSAMRQSEPPGDLGANKQAMESERNRQPIEPVQQPVPPRQEKLLSSDPPHRLQRVEPTPSSADMVDWLAPYMEWQPIGTIPDPRTAEQEQLVALLSEVAECEGPVVAIRAYRLINQASGSQRLTAPARKALNRACTAAVRGGRLTATNPLEKEGQSQLVLRGPDSPEVILRERGSRELDELPPDEIAAMLRLLCKGTTAPDHEQLKRELLEMLNWVRLTRKVSEFLDQCIALI